MRDNPNMNDLEKTLHAVARFFDACRYGCRGNEGYRKSTDLEQMIACLEDLRNRQLIHSQSTSFLDLGCADGRVNILASYFVRISMGIELDEEILGEYAGRMTALKRLIEAQGLELPPDNIHLLSGSSLEARTHRTMYERTGTALEEVDLFYTYITLHDLFGEMIAQKARQGALYLVYGFNRVLPRYEGLELLVPDVGLQGIAALYRKI